MKQKATAKSATKAEVQQRELFTSAGFKLQLQKLHTWLLSIHVRFLMLLDLGQPCCCPQALPEKRTQNKFQEGV